MYSKFDNLIEDTLHFMLMRQLYASDEAYEEMIDGGDQAWRLPCLTIKEFLIPIFYVTDYSCDLDTIIRFIEYYYDNQENYLPDYRLYPEKYEMLKEVVKNETSRGELYGTIKAICQNDEEFLENSQTERTKFMLEIAKQFVELIENGNFPTLRLRYMDQTEAIGFFVDYNCFPFCSMGKGWKDWWTFEELNLWTHEHMYMDN